MQNILLLIFFVRQIYSKIHKPPFKSVNAAKKNLTVSDFLIQMARIRYPRADYSKSRLVGNLSKIFLPQLLSLTLLLVVYSLFLLRCCPHPPPPTGMLGVRVHAQIIWNWIQEWFSLHNASVWPKKWTLKHAA